MNWGLWSDSIKLSNEDAGCVGSNWLCVVDGASPLESSETANKITSRFAHTVVQVIERNGLTPGRMELQIAEALLETQDIVGTNGATATISAVAWDDNVVRTAAMGDSIILIENEDHVLAIQDPEFEGRENRLLTPVVNAIKRGIPPRIAYEQSKHSLSLERRLRNTSEGVWVLSDSLPSHEVLEHLSVKEFSRHSIARVAAMTDGMWRAINLFKLIDAHEILVCAETNEIDPLLSRLQSAEESDPQRALYPRFSYRDDATLAFASLA